MPPGPFAPDFREEPYWWETAPRPQLPAQELPARVDVAVIGSGLTGLNAARVLARAGRSVVVLDAEDAGAGASSRNAGFVGRTLKHEFGAVLRRHGLERAVATYREMQAAFNAVVEVVETEGIACHFERCGRLIVAASEKQQRALLDELELKRQHLGEAYEPLAGPALRAAFPSNRFLGGAVVPDLGSIHPGLYHLGLLSRAQQVGATVLARTPVIEIASEEPGFRLVTPHGSIRAREVLVATNGYTGRGAPPFLRRRLIPFDAYMIATERLALDTARALLPTNRTVIDCNHNIIHLRRSPDGARILFGGQTGARTTSLKSRAAALHRLAARILPGFGDLRLSYAWTGRCAGTFDLYPHVGSRDGIWYAGGYCFAGVPMGTYLGRKVAWQILRDPRGATVFADRGFPTVPLYDGSPWFVPYAMAWYNLLDARAGGSLR